MIDTAPWPAALYGDSLHQKVAAAKVLCIGAGGIGCELLKTLVLSGISHLQIIDMDTIETSNLNRQFLFRRQHVGQSKAIVAADAVQRLNPDAVICGQQANIKDARFNVEYFKQFALILNGLDNLEARRHVNRMALAADVPLIESGTAGYLGQVTVHIKSTTECFECRPKPAPKTYPVCTIRNTPDKFIHCVVWAKELLFPRLLGCQDHTTDLDDGGESSSNRAEPATTSFFLRSTDEAIDAYGERVFDRLFGHDIEKLLPIEELWKSRAKPKPVFYHQLVPPSRQAEINSQMSSNAGVPVSAAKALRLTDSLAVLSLSDSAALFVAALRVYHTQRSKEVGIAIFDKDDVLAVEFVTAAANLRASVYGIPPQSLFDTKGMAGNIVHAIATTNAIIAGLIVTEALKLLAGSTTSIANTFLREHASNKKVLMRTKPEPPLPSCMVCGRSQVGLTLNTSTWTLKQLVDKVLRGALAIICPTVECDNFMYEEGEGLEEDEVQFYQRLLPLPLFDLPGGAVRHGGVVSVKDQLQNLDVTLVITHQDSMDEDLHPEGFVLHGNTPQPLPGDEIDVLDNATKKQLPRNAPHPDDDDDGIMLVSAAEQDGEKPCKAGSKRKGTSADVSSDTDNSKRQRKAEVMDLT